MEETLKIQFQEKDVRKKRLLLATITLPKVLVINTFKV